MVDIISNLQLGFMRFNAWVSVAKDWPVLNKMGPLTDYNVGLSFNDPEKCIKCGSP